MHLRLYPQQIKKRNSCSTEAIIKSNTLIGVGQILLEIISSLPSFSKWVFYIQKSKNCLKSKMLLLLN